MAVIEARRPDPALSDGELAHVIEAVSRKLRAQEPVDLEEYAAGDPRRLQELEQMLPTLRALADLGHSASDPSGDSPQAESGEPRHGTLGDFRIVREIGRGGMGVVYEAEQISLRRQIALKVLPFAAMLDPRQLKRFKNEAQAAAGLHHQNIVPVYGIGCERGVHYYAMQYIEGQTLAELVRDLRRIEGLDGAEEDAAHDRTEGYTLGSRGDAETRQSCPATAETGRPVQAEISTQPTTRSLQYFRTVAQFGIQVAEALDHAHEEGVIHRDIKPSNLILDAGGKVWVTDFGLARVEADPGLTMTGDIVGTLRYMSPEQALAKRVIVDHRADIYSLGVTLYELLALQPAFPEKDRQELLRRIAFEEPPAPRKLNKNVPADLETIVLKAMAKNSSDRYAMVRDLADDLQRFLEDRPIRARRPTLLQYAGQFVRRYATVVLSTGLVAGLALAAIVVVLAVSNSRIQRALESRTATLRRLVAEHEKTEAAERGRRHQLGLAKLNEARALRLGGQPGRRFRSLERLHESAHILASLGRLDERVLELRNEAIACLDLVDLEGAESWALRGNSYPSFDAAGERYAQASKSGITITSVTPDDPSTVHLPATDDVRSAPGTVFSPDGKYLAAVHYHQRDCRIWKLATREVILRLPVSRGAMAFSPDGRFVAAGESEGTVSIRELLSGQLSKTLSSASHPESLCFDPSGRFLAVCHRSKGDIEVWNLDTAAVVCRLTPRGSTGACSLAWSPDGRLLAGGFLDGVTYVWDVKSRREISVLRGHRGAVVGLAFDPTVAVLASKSHDTTTRLWDPMTGVHLLTIDGHFGQFSPDGKFLTFNIPYRYTAGRWRVAPLDAVTRLHLPPSSRGPFDLDVAPNGLVLASADYDGARIWSLVSGRELGQISSAHTRAVFFGPDGKSLLTVGQSGLQRWPVHVTPDGQQVELGSAVTLDGPSSNSPRWIRADCSADGRFVAWTPAAGAIHVISIEDGGSQWRVSAEEGECVGATALSPDGRWLAATIGTRDHPDRVCVWSTGDEELVVTLPHPGAEGYTTLAFSPNGRWLVCRVHQAYCFWDVDTWRLCHRVAQDYSLFGPIAFSPDGALIAIAWSRSKVQLLDANRLSPAAMLEGRDLPLVTALSFTPDSQTLAVSSETRVVCLWRLDRVRRRLAALGIDWETTPTRGDDESKTGR